MGRQIEVYCELQLDGHNWIVSSHLLNNHCFIFNLCCRLLVPLPPHEILALLNENALLYIYNDRDISTTSIEKLSDMSKNYFLGHMLN